MKIQITKVPNRRAEGGWLSSTHGSNWDSGINLVAEGGSHEQNPYGGVMVGTDEQGTPNLVEENEIIWNGDYVFSKRMKVPKKLAKKYGLGGDMTFADAIAKLTKDSEERPLSNIDRATNNHILGEFADSQEELRMAKAQRAMDKEIQLQDDFLTGFQFGLGGHMSPLGIVPDADNISPFEKAEKLFADGGGIHIDPSKKGTFKAQASKMGMGVQEAASHILAHKENYSPEMVKKANFARNSSKWHEDGGSLFTNPFAYGGEMGNVFDGDGNKPNTLRPRAFDYPIFDAPWGWGMAGTTDIAYPSTKKSFGDMQNENWFKIYNPDQWYGPENDPLYQGATVSTSNREGKKGKNNAKSSAPSQRTNDSVRKPSSNGIISYGYYTNGSDGISEPTGFKVGKGGRAYEYTKEYRDLVDNLTADDIRAWAKAHPDDPSLKSFLARGNSLDKLTTEQWRKGATDGKYGFMHHVAEQKLQESTRGLDMPEGNIRWTPDPTVIENPQISKLPTSTTTSGTGQSGAFSPKQTWTRNLPWMMSGIMGLKEMLTPADYGNADMILDAAYRVGQPVSVGTEYIGDYRRRDPFDERYLMNIINQNRAAANRNMMNFSGGNRAIGMAGILTNDLTSQMSLAEAARRAYLANRADDADVAAFNKDTNKYNATAQNTRNLSLAQLNSGRQSAMLSGISQGARLRQAIKDQRDAAIYGNLSNFAQGLGDIGWENSQYNMIGGLADEDVLKYIFDKDFITTYKNRLNKNNTGEG